MFRACAGCCKTCTRCCTGCCKTCTRCCRGTGRSSRGLRRSSSRGGRRSSRSRRRPDDYDDDVDDEYLPRDEYYYSGSADAPPQLPPLVMAMNREEGTVDLKCPECGESLKAAEGVGTV